ncbi:MAG: lysine--tRNA ligase [Candidatus Woykebacteria bacterium RBG_13_40_15]|uniref:Lysine--tRNA ligase n=1 Tax=Candidatus Woykebacteria bacterium RBG_13_40_15 TaxID=1802593 RepID=A0A1G1W5G5_9BACT|nr:MAG: lysine--tRNA ligase [Candidatus Woykebacteria bacterium RBG_13_40_15]
MFWAGEIAKKLKEKGRAQLVNDAKTPSGRVHVGALRGVLIHDLIYKSLLTEKVEAKYTYIIDDFDPMDSLPTYLPKEKYEKYMGTPLKDVPAPEGKVSYAEYFATEFINVFKELGANPEILWTSKIYKEGKLDKQIKIALDSAEKIQEIYEKVSGSKRPRDFIPFQPVCEKCGKIGTTIATDWDGKLVYYKCDEKKVDWAKGCGYEGSVSPYGGTGKLPFRVEWPAKWAAFCITVEGAGKDHISKGGTRDTAEAIAKEVFKIEPAYNIPYEHFLVSGKKMSSSKGIGVSAKEISEILPPVVLRFLIIRTRPAQHLDFDPTEPDTIPKLFDDFDSAKVSKDPEIKEVWGLSHTDSQPSEIFVLRFRDLVNLVQMPNINISDEAKKQKGKDLTEEERKALEKRVGYVKIYIERFAPENVKFSVKESLPKEVKELSESQRKLLLKIAEELEDPPAGGPEDFQNEIYKVGKDLGLSSAETFSAIYVALLGKESGPKAAWLMLSLDREFVKKRFTEVVNG